MKTLRFLFINRAARLARISGRKALRFSHKLRYQMLYNQVADHLIASRLEIRVRYALAYRARIWLAFDIPPTSASLNQS
jgi:hypothetical protein